MSFSKSQGFTLIELMLSMGLGIVAVSTIMYFYSTNLFSSYALLQTSKLNQETASLMQLMVQDIRRAGYSSILVEDGDPSNNAFSNDNRATRLAIYNTDDNTEIGQQEQDDGSANCIVYSYDVNNTDGDINSSDFFGFRLKNAQIEMRLSDSDLNNNDCEETNNEWEPVTSFEDITVTKLNFDLNGSTCLGINTLGKKYNCYDQIPLQGDKTVETRQVRISLVASLADDPDVSLSLESLVRVRNDHVRSR